jgi:hypothetical protein
VAGADGCGDGCCGGEVGAGMTASHTPAAVQAMLPTIVRLAKCTGTIGYQQQYLLSEAARSLGIIEDLLAEVAALRAALLPFVASYNRAADHIGDSDLYGEQPRSVHVTLGDCRKAARIAATNCPVCGVAPGGKHV